MVKRVMHVDFEEQLPKEAVDKVAEEIKEESEREIARLKSRWSRFGLESRIREIRDQANRRIADRYTVLYNSRLVIAKMNTASFYSQLYREIFGGNVLRKFKTEKEQYENGGTHVERNFHPDHIRYDEHRKIFCEIKTVSDRNSKPWCSSTQLENYCHDLLTDSFETMFNPELEYAFFRYRHRTSEDPKTSVLTNTQLARKLARDTKDLLIVPSNLLFLMLVSSNGNWINQESNKGPDEVHYWKIYGKLISRLHQEENPVLEIAESFRRESGIDATREFCLDNIGVIRRESPKGIYCRDRIVRPFPITRYYNAGNKWSEYFKQNHGRVLGEILKIRDLYDELGGVPF
jgi:hypothetical protein